MSLSGDPGCGQRSQESPLYNLDGNLVLQLGDPQVRRAGVPCRGGTANTLFCIQALDRLCLCSSTPGHPIRHALPLILAPSPHG